MAETELKAWRETRAGLLLFLKVTPNASRDEIGDIVADADGQGQLVVRVRAVPEKGKANKAVVKLLAKQLGCRASAIEVLKGETSRQKQVCIADLTEHELKALLI
ncbi:hypothetical protein ATL17_2809 [Maritalea mobilis]|uniref:UPF0235 protein ATL17_2809 n=1 Tax=Maritalea mobilis TaxID=483324 RepID=A0A4R6VJE3_9HYPH|nr:DUF167 family protein [Maritalea mobilis]TDQ61708.1 hypothetical protein ATL17_2809 [Maritalea mobilis]